MECKCRDRARHNTLESERVVIAPPRQFIARLMLFETCLPSRCCFSAYLVAQHSSVTYLSASHSEILIHYISSFARLPGNPSNTHPRSETHIHYLSTASLLIQNLSSAYPREIRYLSDTYLKPIQSMCGPSNIHPTHIQHISR